MQYIHIQVYIGHDLGLTMKSSSIIVVPIKQKEQTRVVASLPSLTMQKGRASKRIIMQVPLRVDTTLKWLNEGAS